ncbi:MAG: hypothetical protein V3R56_04125 [Xanthomonadales bacterium]
MVNGLFVLHATLADEVLIPTQRLDGLEFVMPGDETANREDIGTLNIAVRGCATKANQYADKPSSSWPFAPVICALRLPGLSQSVQVVCIIGIVLSRPL